jgi:2'-5' RNA ligase
MKKHRIFIAINLPEGVRKKLAEYQTKWPELPIRWTRPKDIHITLVFLGYLTDEELLEICRITKEVASKHTSFNINLTKICYGPTDKKPPRMIWAVGEKSEEFISLKNDLDKSLAFSENREFSPHITLGRVRKWEWQRIEPEERPEVNEDISLSFSVSSIEVMKSSLKRTGAEYSVLESHNLGET